MCNKYLPEWLGGKKDELVAVATQKAPAVPDPAIAAQKATEDDIRRRAGRKGQNATIISGGLGDPSFGQSSQAAKLATYLG